MKMSVFLFSSIISLCLKAQEPQKILFLGASITSGFGVAPSESVPSLFESALTRRGAHVVVKNAATPGAATNHGISQLNRFLKAGFIPDQLFIALGLSDAVYNTSTPEINET